MKRIFAIGLCLGNRAETSALAVVELVRPQGLDDDCPPDSCKFNVRHLCRFPPGTRYTDISQHVTKILHTSELSQPKVQTYFVVDQRAVGSPMVKMIRDQVGMEICQVVIKGQDVETSSNGIHFIPKQIVLGGIDVSLELANLKIAQHLDETKNLTEELITFQCQPSSVASLSGDTWRELPSDDLIFATGIACWKLRNPSYFKVDWIG